MDKEKIIQEWENNSRKVTIERQQYSIRELVSLYEEGDLIIKPEYQRYFRWDKKQKTDLIESVLLGIPLPPIFVAENLEGRWEVIDGLQRLSTFFEYLGVLKEKYKSDKKKSIENGLLEPYYLKSIEGNKFEELPKEMQKKIRNSYRIDVIILTRESDISAKYELFNRLNSGGTPLTKQEIRNSLILQFNRSIYDMFCELREDEGFINVLSPSEKDKEIEADTELILRFFSVIHKEGNYKDIKSVSLFLDKMMRSFILKKPDITTESEKKYFNKTFEILNNAFENNSLKRFNPKKDNFSGRVMVPAFDAIAGGIGYNLKEGNISEDCTENSNCIEEIKKRIKALWMSEQWNKHTGSKSGWFVEHKLQVAMFIGRKIFDLTVDFGNTKKEIVEKVDELINKDFPKKK